MKKKYFVIVLLSLAILLCLTACDDVKNYEGQAKVTFELEGGTFKNCTRPVVHYYKLNEGQTTTIREMTGFSEEKFERAGYVLEGWYKTKTASGDYSDKWNFDTDTIDKDGVTLYAKWVLPITYAYEVRFVCEDDGTSGVLGTYVVSQGSKFRDNNNYIVGKELDGYTEIERVDENGNEWNEDFTHPGGEKDLTIPVIVKFVKGDYTVVKTADELKAVTSGNIYLCKDIDMQGQSLSLKNFTSGTIVGNNHKISNFKLSYSDGVSDLVFDEDGQRSLFISLFGNLQDAEIKDVIFENVTLDITTGNREVKKIYVSPFADELKNSTLKNVQFKYTYSIGVLPDSFYEQGVINSELLEISQEVFRIKDGNSSATDCSVTATVSESK